MQAVASVRGRCSAKMVNTRARVRALSQWQQSVPKRRVNDTLIQETKKKNLVKMDETTSDLVDYYGENDPGLPTTSVRTDIAPGSSDRIYPGQIAIANIILERIKMRLVNCEKFTSVDFQIYMPNKKVLGTQTSHRICQTPNVLPSRIRNFLGTDQEGKFFSSVHSGFYT